VAICLRDSCQHPDTDHDQWGLCERCMCAQFLHPEDALLDEPAPFTLDDPEEDEEQGEPEPLDFGEDADR
jgi:hypothetical protein